MTNNGQKTELTEKYQIDQACIEEIKPKYLQTSNAVCMQEPFKSLLGRFGDTQFCDKILRGEATFLPGTQHTSKIFSNN